MVFNDDFKKNSVIKVMNPGQNESVLALRIICQLFFSITFCLLFMQISVVGKLQDPIEEECLSLGLRVTSRGGRE